METRCSVCRRTAAQFACSCAASSVFLCTSCVKPHRASKGTHVPAPLQKKPSGPAPINAICDSCGLKPALRFCLCAVPLRKFCEDCDVAHFSKAPQLNHSEHPISTYAAVASGRVSVEAFRKKQQFVNDFQGCLGQQLVHFDTFMAEVGEEFDKVLVQVSEQKETLLRDLQAKRITLVGLLDDAQRSIEGKRYAESFEIETRLDELLFNGFQGSAVPEFRAFTGQINFEGIQNVLEKAVTCTVASQLFQTVQPRGMPASRNASKSEIVPPTGEIPNPAPQSMKKPGRVAAAKSTLEPKSGHPLPASISGHRPPDSQTILLMGETGSGKSTFINYVANYFLGGTPLQPKIVIPNRIYRRVTESGFPNHSEADLDNPMISQTTVPVTYSFQKDGVSYRFIDTPGLSDTENTGERCVDDQKIPAILEAASKAGELQAIVLVINGTTARVTVNLKNALNRIAGNYPDVLLSNMLVVFTNTTAGAMNFDYRSLIHQPKKSFIMNNAALSSPSNSWDDDERGMQETFWKQSMRKMKEIIYFINQLTPQPTIMFRTMLFKSNQINGEILRATNEIIHQQLLLEELEKNKREIADLDFQLAQEQLQEKQEREKTEARTRVEREFASDQVRAKIQQLDALRQKGLTEDYYKEKKSIRVPKNRSTPYYNTNCKVCMKTCHESCGLDYTHQAGDPSFQDCARMDPDHTTGQECPCRYGTHVHVPYVIEYVTIEEETINVMKKDEYVRDKNEIARLEQEVAAMQISMQEANEEAQKYEQKLSSMSKQASSYRSEEAKARKMKEEALSTKQAVEDALRKVQNQKTGIQRKLTDLENKIQEAKRTLETAKSIVEANCRELKSICSMFNFVEELSTTKATLRMQLSSLRTPQSRASAEAFIVALDQIASELTKDR